MLFLAGRWEQLAALLTQSRAAVWPQHTADRDESRTKNTQEIPKVMWVVSPKLQNTNLQVGGGGREFNSDRPLVVQTDTVCFI